MFDEDFLDKLAAKIADNIKLQPVEKTKEEFLTPKQTAAYLSVSEQTLSSWRLNKTVELPYVKLGSCVRYLLSDIVIYAKTKTH